MQTRALARPLAHAFLIGDSDLAAILEHGETILGRRWPWLLALRLPELADEVARREVHHPDCKDAFSQPNPGGTSRSGNHPSGKFVLKAA
jgi:hypothetical protein